MNRDTPHPLSKRNILAYVGANLTLGIILGYVADVIQVLSVKNGIYILLVIFGVSIIVFAIQLFTYQYKQIEQLQNNLDEEQIHSEDLEDRLEKLKVEFRSRSPLNPRPMLVNAIICTKKLAQSPLDIIVKHVTQNLIVIDKGDSHGLAYGMYFAVFMKGNEQCLEVCPVERIESDNTWLLHSGDSIHGQMQPTDLTVQVVEPPDIQDHELGIAEILLIADGHYV